MLGHIGLDRRRIAPCSVLSRRAARRLYSAVMKFGLFSPMVLVWTLGCASKPQYIPIGAAESFPWRLVTVDVDVEVKNLVVDGTPITGRKFAVVYGTHEISYVGHVPSFDYIIEELSMLRNGYALRDGVYQLGTFHLQGPPIPPRSVPYEWRSISISVTLHGGRTYRLSEIEGNYLREAAEKHLRKE